jgi:two-component system cell cycle response regulator DivK
MTGSSAAPAGRQDERPLVLLVEDHADTRQMYAEFLGSTFRMREAADGNEALASVRANPPDVLVTDLSLPGIDGFELMALMRADPALRSIPIVCLSGYGGQAHDDRARAAGCTRILQKPCLPDALADVVAEVLRECRDGSAAP